MAPKNSVEIDESDAGFLLQDMDGGESKKSIEIDGLDGVVDLSMGTVEVEGGLGRHLGVYSSTLLM